NSMIQDEMGVIFRTVSENTDSVLLEDEYYELCGLYRNIESEKNFLPTPKLIYRELDLVSQVIRDYFNFPNTEIIVNEKDMALIVGRNKDLIRYDMEGIVKLDPLFSMDYHMSIQLDMKEALSRRVQLKSGGYIAIDETEALTA